MLASCCAGWGEYGAGPRMGRWVVGRLLYPCLIASPTTIPPNRRGPAPVFAPSGAAGAQAWLEFRHRGIAGIAGTAGIAAIAAGAAGRRILRPNVMAHNNHRLSSPHHCNRCGVFMDIPPCIDDGATPTVLPSGQIVTTKFPLVLL